MKDKVYSFRIFPLVFTACVEDWTYGIDIIPYIKLNTTKWEWFNLMCGWLMFEIKITLYNNSNG